ncbi:universal stress protein [Cyclobacterium xiamenense]|uniref:universal stress protein n=1 Tax=Cyclobacterium xiamenense TaxID=1297121 RepID=UPI0035D007A4
MKTYTILCPTDFSECSLNAIEYAAKLGEKWNATLILLHVPDKEDYEDLFPGQVLEDSLQTAKKKLQSLVDTVREESLPRGLTDCKGLVQEGETIGTILEMAESQSAHLIVMGTEGINEFKKNYIGTKSSKVVLSADCDVFIIPRKVFFKTPRKLVYATNYLEEDKLAIQRVVDFASVFDSELDIVHVSTRVNTIDKALHLTMVEEVAPFVSLEKVNYVLKSYRDDPGLGLESYLITAKGNVLFTLSKKKSWFEQFFTKNLSKKMSFFINKPLYVIKRL